MAQYLKEDLREKIVHSAREEFIKKGYDRASMRSIARKSGMTAGNLYRYFKNKEELYSFFVEPIITDIIKYLNEDTKQNLNLERKSSRIPGKLAGSRINRKEILPAIERLSSFIAEYAKKRHPELLLLITNLKNYKIREGKGIIPRWINELVSRKIQIERGLDQLSLSESVYADMLTDSFLEGVFTLIAEYGEDVEMDKLLYDYCLATFDMIK